MVLLRLKDTWAHLADTSYFFFASLDTTNLQQQGNRKAATYTKDKTDIEKKGHNLLAPMPHLK